MTMYFKSQCGVCGRGAFVRIEQYGREVKCAHCHARFVATEGTEPYQRGDGSSLIGAKIPARPMACRAETPSVSGG